MGDNLRAGRRLATIAGERVVVGEFQPYDRGRALHLRPRLAGEPRRLRADEDRRMESRFEGAVLRKA